MCLMFAKVSIVLDVLVWAAMDCILKLSRYSVKIRQVKILRAKFAESRPQYRCHDMSCESSCKRRNSLNFGSCCILLFGLCSNMIESACWARCGQITMPVPPSRTGNRPFQALSGCVFLCTGVILSALSYVVDHSCHFDILWHGFQGSMVNGISCQPI